MRRVVHEIRNHLAVAIANIEAFRDGVFEPTPQRLAAVLQALGEVDVLLRDVSPTAEFHGLESVPRLINVCDIITNEILALEASAAERGIVFRVSQCAEHTAECRNFLGDPTRVAEIVNNVVSNAIRYTPQGGEIDIDCRRSAEQLTLTVTDGGPGIAAADMSHIFESGYRGGLAELTGHNGFGLALVKTFVEAHGGAVTAENVPAGGARFTIRLPGSALAAPDGSISLP